MWVAEPVGLQTLTMEPPPPGEIQEAVTTAAWVGQTWAAGSTSGKIRLHDFRMQAQHGYDMFETETGLHPWLYRPATPGLGIYSDVCSAVQDVKFAGEYIFARDWLNVTIWDRKMTNVPLQVVPVNDHLLEDLEECVENTSLFETFDVAPSADGKEFATGCFDGVVRVHDSCTGKLKHSILTCAEPLLPPPPITTLDTGGWHDEWHDDHASSTSSSLSAVGAIAWNSKRRQFACLSEKAVSTHSINK